MLPIFILSLIVMVIGIVTVAVGINKREKIGDTAFVCMLFFGGLLTLGAIVFALCVGFFLK